MIYIYLNSPSHAALPTWDGVGKMPEYPNDVRCGPFNAVEFRPDGVWVYENGPRQYAIPHPSGGWELAGMPDAVYESISATTEKH